MKVLDMLKFSNIFKLFAYSFVAITIVSNVHLKNKVDALDNALAISKSNVEQYQNILSKTQETNRTLLLTVEDFKRSNDSIVKRLNSVRDSLKVKDKELKRALSTTIVITDTLTEKIPMDRDFNVTLKSNPMTVFKISRRDSSITCIPEIYSHQDIIVCKRKVWRNKYKNGFRRFLHFDFKKDEIESYRIINSNPIFKTKDTRVINITN